MLRKGFAVLAALAGGGLIAAAPVAAAAQAGADDRITVWDGIYTAAQAERGRSVYESACAACHGANLDGTAEARPLAGERFVQDWSEDTLDNLFGRIQRLMPYDDPGSLDEAAYLDTLAFILQFNAFPAGDSELVAEAVADIRVEGKDGPGPVPSFALVRVVGCLAAGADGDWTLTSSTRAERARDPAASSPDELRTLDAQPLGDRTFTLMSAYPDPAPHAGHKMEAKGFLIRNPAGDRINLSALEMIAERCEP